MAFFRPDNSCQFIGRLGKEPKEIGDDRYSFSIAVNNPPDKSGKETPPDWPLMFVSGQPASFLKKYCNKGDQLIVTCLYRTWKDKEGNSRHGFDVVQLSKLGSSSDRGDDTSRKVTTKTTRADDNDTDIPF